MSTLVHFVWDGELTLDAPVEQAWPLVLDYPAWQSYSKVEHISGEPGGEGEIVLLSKDEEGFELPPYYSKVLKLAPPRRVIWKTYPEEGSDFFGIVEFQLHEAGQKTRFEYHLIYEFTVPFEDEQEIAAFRESQEENFGALFASVLPKLVELVAGAARVPG
jgi:polyketide cyclase/dehydrase/lipid transport protein